MNKLDRIYDRWIVGLAYLRCPVLLAMRLYWVSRPPRRIAPLLLHVTLADYSAAPNGAARKEVAVGTIVWRDWSDDVFVRAKAENKLVLLDLGAVWCHWCYVMEATTYRDPAVIRLVDQKYIAVRVDQDARPDLSTRYEDYGWPETVVFGPDGKELVTRRRYVPPDPMAAMLKAIIDDPTRGPSI